MNKFRRALPTVTGAGVIPWMANALNVSIDELTELARQSQPGANGVLVLPYFSGAGERAPFLNASARGAILGATLETSKSDVARAFFGSLAHASSEC